MVNNKKIIAVKGSGMIACLCSLMLAKFGHDVIHVSKGVTKKNDMFFAITPTSIEWFRELGFPDIFFDQLHKISEIQLFDEIYGNKINFKADDFYIDSLAYMAKQKHFAEALKDLNTNINTIVDDASIAHSCNDESVDIHINGDTIKASLLIICDDGDSLINEEKFHSTAIEYDQTALTFVFKSEGGIFNQASQYFYEDSILALLPLDSNEVGVVWSCNKKLKNYLLSLEEIDLVTILQERIKKIFNIEVPLKNRHAFDLRAKNLESIFNKRILLMGDAAHTIHPMAGQGFNLGLRDIQCFEKLIAEKSTMDFGARNFLRKYERMRARDVTQLSTLTTSISNILFENKSFIKKARNKLLLSSVSKLKSSKYFKNYLVKQAIL